MSTRRQHGFTLVEVMVAGFVLVVGILAVLAVFASAFRTSNVSERNEVMARQAEHQIEEMRALCYGSMTLTETVPAGDLPAGAEYVGNGLKVANTPTEELVVDEPVKEDGDGCEDSDGDGDADAGIAPVSTFTVGSGSSAVRGRVFRFVTWRDEECPVVNLTHLTTLVDDLETTLQGLVGPSGALTNLVGPNGGLAGAIANANKVKNTVSGATSLERLLYGTTLTTILNTVNPLLTTALQPLNAQLQPLLAPLQETLTALEALGTDPDQILDLCDLPELVDLSSLETMNAALTALAPILQGLQAPVQAAGGILNNLAALNVVGLVANVGNVLLLPPYTTAMVSSLGQIDTALDAAFDDAANAPARFNELGDTLVEGLTALVTQPDHERNTKRLTVAVVLDDRGPGTPGPFAPFWASSVVSDPEDGLL